MITRSLGSDRTGTFPKGHNAYLTRVENATIIAALSPDDPKPVHIHTTFEFHDPTDLRGIPAIGTGVGGVIRGTRPDAICDR
jgi:hypothetical protein